jgi:Domain of unknown function (DUF222)
MAMGTLECVEDRLADLCGHRNSLDALLVRLVAEALETGVWEMPGIVSPAHWLAWKAGLSSAHAQQLVTVARRRGELPVTFRAFDAGELSLDQVAPIATKAPRWADSELCEFAKLATVTQLRRVLRSYDFPPDPTTNDDGDDPQPVVSRPVESLSLWHGDDGRWELRGDLDADHGAVLDAALREAQDAVFHRDGVVASKVDALVEIANRSLDSIVDVGRRDRYRVHVHLDVDNTMLDGLGHHLPTWLRDLICCDTILSTVNEQGGIPVSVGRTQRTVPERTRRLVILRDRGCRVPGCNADRVLEVHHVIHWDPDHGNGGTDTWNLACLCPRHHRLHHQGRLGISGNADDPHGLIFTDTFGHVMHPAAVARPPTAPPPQPTGRYQHPLGERLHMRWVTFNPPPPPTPANTNWSSPRITDGVGVG